MWQYDGLKRGQLATNNISKLMVTIMKPLALFLVTQDSVLHAGENAAAPFNFYEFKPPKKGSAC